MRTAWSLLLSMTVVACAAPQKQAESGPKLPTLAEYFDNSGRDDAVAGGVRMIPIATPKGEFRVWTRRTGNNPG